MQTTENFLPASTGQDLGSSSQLWDIYAQHITAQRIGNRRFVERFSGATLGAQIIAAIADLPATGGIVDASAAEGAQTISADVFSGVTKPGILLLGACTITLSATQNLPNNWIIQGIGDTTLINYNQATDVAFDINAKELCILRGFSLAATSGGNTATGIRIRNAASYNILAELFVDAFANNIILTGTNAPARPFDTRILNCNVTNHTAIGIGIDHSLDTYIINTLNWAVTNNPTTAWGVVIDTGARNVFIHSMDMLYAGFRIRHSSPGTGTYDHAPAFIYADQVLSDTITGTDAIQLNSELGVVDGVGRYGKSYYFNNCGAFNTQTDGTVGIAIDGGNEAHFIGCRSRLNRYHGIEITAGNNHRFTNCCASANNQQNAADGDGYRIAANINNFQIIGGAAVDDIAGETGNQKYGIRVAAGTSANYSIIGVDTSTGNDTGGIFDGGTGTGKVVTNNVGTVSWNGNTVTQLSNKSTGVTLDKLSGVITMNNAQLNAATSVGFTLTNAMIGATDVVAVSIKSGATADAYAVTVDATADGSCRIQLRNVSGGNLSEAVVLNFVVLKGVAA